MLNGIDIARYQKGINLSVVPCDFVIVKATQGISYVSPTFREQIGQANLNGKLLGVYHYAGGGGAVPEAKHFVKTVREYIGNAILVLDWEGEQNPNFGNPNYAKEFLATVKKETGITPFIYMSKSVCRQYAWDSSYPLWCAQYKNQQPTGYQDDPWTDSKGFGAWKDCVILQYSSKGRLYGYDKNLDLDKAYIDREQWLKYASGDMDAVENPKPVVDTSTLPVLKMGSVGNEVRAWQTYLNQHGFDCGEIDGIFGKRTRNAVIEYQKANPECGKPDGIIGQRTWASLLK